MGKLKIKMLRLEELKPYENNPRNNDEAVDYVANSIREFGFNVPIIIDKDRVIIAGHTRLKAAQKLGIGEVPCIMADDLTPGQVKAFRLVDNKVAELSTWDYNLLDQETAILQQNGFDMEQFGFRMPCEIDLSGICCDEQDDGVDDGKIVCPHCGRVVKE